jgi:hypothetical protein
MNHSCVIIVLTVHLVFFFTYLLVLVTDMGKTTIVQDVLYWYTFHLLVRFSNESCVEMFQQVSYGSLFLLLRMVQAFRNYGVYSSGFPV